MAKKQKKSFNMGKIYRISNFPITARDWKIDKKALTPKFIKSLKGKPVTVEFSSNKVIGHIIKAELTKNGITFVTVDIP